MKGLPFLSKTEYQRLRVSTWEQNLPVENFQPHKQIAKGKEIQFYWSFSKISAQRDQNG